MKMYILLIYFFHFFLITIHECSQIKISLSRLPRHKLRESLSFETVSSRLFLDNYYDVQYVGVLYVGNNKQKFRVVFDTGSTWLFIPDKTCDTCIAQKFFDCNTSLTCQPYIDRSLMDIKYGKGEVQGYQYYDSVELFENITVNKQRMLLAAFQKDFDGYQADGLCGLGLGGFYNGLNIIGNLFNEQKIDQNLFAFRLTRRSDEGDSQMMIGGFDESLLAENLTYFPVKPGMHWEIKIDKSYLGDDILSEISSYAVVDTGTSLIIAPQNIYFRIYSLFNQKFNGCLNLNIGIKCPCPNGDLNNFPTLKWDLNGVILTLEPEFYVSQYYNECIVNINVINSFDNMWIFGDIFLHKYFAVFDAGNLRVGLGKSIIEEKNSSNYKKILIYVGIAIGAFIVAIFIILFIKYLGKKKRNETYNQRLLA